MVPRLAITTLVLCAGCTPFGPLETDTDTDDRPAALSITPTRLAFDINASEAPSAPLTLDLYNGLDEEVVVFDWIVDGDPVFQIGQQGFLRLEPGQELSVDVRFNPPHGGRFEARIPLRADPVDDPPPITLIGEASGPDPVLTALAADETPVYCSRDLIVDLANDGPDTLDVVDVQLGDEPGCSSFFVDGDPSELSVKSGSSARLPVRFQPDRPDDVLSCALTVTSDLPVPVATVLRGTAINNEIAEERFSVSDGSGANLLILFDDGAPLVNDATRRVREGLTTLLAQLRIEGVDFRIMAVSTDDACTSSAFPYGTPLNQDEDLIQQLQDSLFDPGTTWADQPLALLSQVAGRQSSACYRGWYEPAEPLHVVIISARDDNSGRTPGSWISSVRADLTAPLSISAIRPGGSCAAVPQRLGEAIEETGGLALDLCDSDWTAHWRNLANHTANVRAPRYQQTLAALPLAPSLKVAVNGIATQDYAVVDLGGDPQRVAIKVSETVPDAASVLVRYAEVNTCR